MKLQYRKVCVKCLSLELIVCHVGYIGIIYELCIVGGTRNACWNVIKLKL